MLLPLCLLSIVAAAWLMGWGILRVLAGLFLIWLIVLALMLAAPASEFKAFGTLDVRSWLALGVALGLGLGYASLVGAIRARVGANLGGAQAAPGMTGSEGARLQAPDSEQDAAVERYARHIVLREIGGPGQQKLRDASVLIVGAGGLGAPAALYLAGAGVGRINIADPDTVSLSNLQRQIIYRTTDTGRPKGLAAAEALRALNPLINVEATRRRITDQDESLIGKFDIVLDGTDSFSERAAINAACVAAGVPLIAGAISQWEGQLATYDPSSGGPCFACVFPEQPAPGLALPCAEAGVVGPLPGVIGSMMALEAIKYITGAGEGMTGKMMIYDGLYGETRSISVKRRPDCPVCSGVEARPHEA
ncbi:HesA/MoeB/ThiF family protein [Paracoccus albus]|nr:HesA/MoeB/ThiF family protein [Paracoccus albus]WBU61963.1 HesA/MoeB/ThiF family protein [Paracoccus albus]